MSFSSLKNFDAIVIGGGHAGVEAARALSVMGQSVALVTLDPEKMGAMSCNPSIGGVAKGHLVYEIDALGGWMGACADQNTLQARRLNTNRGPAVRSTRVQCDKNLYAATMSDQVAKLENLSVVKGEVSEVLYDSREGVRRVSGVRLKGELELRARAVVITAGTFMRGLMFCGKERSQGGRFGDSASEFLSSSIESAGHVLQRLKTGTPARLDSRSINFSILEKQWGDPERRYFSWSSKRISRLPQLCCYMTYTNEATHSVIRDHFSESPLFSGEIQGVGPRYCPSIEDKVRRFAERLRHQIFLEPEALDSDFIYPNGMSTSLSAKVQLKFLRTIVGLEAVELKRPGYAVEYDTIDPTSLRPSLMSKNVEGLFFAGQVNRSSGYEEAAAQGLWAGINAGLFCQDKEMLLPMRSRSYLETLVDDLVSRGTNEPYRIFTSRSEFRLLLREDNAAERLYSLGLGLGLLSEAQKRAYATNREQISKVKEHLSAETVRLDKDRVVSLYEYLRRPEVSWESLALDREMHDFENDAIEQVEIEAKYSGYLKKQEAEIKEIDRVMSWTLSFEGQDVFSISGVSSEICEKVSRVRPRNVYELSKISGMTPAAVLLIAKAAGRSSLSSSLERFT